MATVQIEGLGSVWTCPLCRGLFLEAVRAHHRRGCVWFNIDMAPEDEVIALTTTDARRWTRDTPGLDAWSTTDAPAASARPFSDLSLLGVLRAEFAPLGQ